MIDIIVNNPYRVLGVYSNSPQKEIVANQGRMKAFLKVGKEVEFPLDLKGMLPPVSRTAESVADAVSKLTLPAEQLRYAQFWFAKATQFDDIAFGKLQSGDIDGAVDVWSKKDNVSSLQNRIVCALIKGSYGIAIQCAEKLYSDFSHEFVTLVLGDNATVSADNLHETFLDALLDCQKPSQLLGWISVPQWKEYAASQSTKPLIDSILSAIETAKATKGKGCTARLNAGTKLLNDTRQTLSQLKLLLPASDLQYQMIADKLGLAILQCGIDYYNDSEDANAAHKAMVLQEYANSIVVGQMAKDRCRENVDILKKIISELPPSEVSEEDKAVKTKLLLFRLQPKEITNSIELVKNCAPHLVAIKSKLGKTNEYYLRISTLVANSALGNLIEEVNKAQESDDIPALIKVLTEAWWATLYLDKLDKTKEYASGRYHECRNALHNIIDRLNGFELPSIFYSYRYGCGWANNLDVSDVDLRTEEEFYAECETLAELNEYLERFPKGRHRKQTQNRIDKIEYDSCKNKYDYQRYVRFHPNSRYVEEAQQKIAEIERIEAVKRTREARQRKEIEACKSLQEVLDVLFRERRNGIDEGLCGQKALLFCVRISDYESVRSAFGKNSKIGQEATRRIDQMEQEAAEKKRVWFFVFVIAIIIGTFGYLYYEDYQKELQEQEEEQLEFESVQQNKSIDACMSYIDHYPTGKHKGEVLDLWLDILVGQCRNFDMYSVEEDMSEESSPLKMLYEYFEKNAGTGNEELAEWYLNEFIDSLYNVADQRHSIDVWNKFISYSPLKRDAYQRIEELEDSINWSTEVKAWNTATQKEGIEVYRKYLSLYPNGVHHAQAEKKLIDLEVSNIYSGDHGVLPGMDKVGYGSGSTSKVEIENNTSYTMTILYSGPDSKRLVISPHTTGTFRLPNGTYRVAASVSSSSVRSYAGTESLTGGTYSASYYISTSHVRF